MGQRLRQLDEVEFLEPSRKASEPPQSRAILEKGRRIPRAGPVKLKRWTIESIQAMNTIGFF